MTQLCRKAAELLWLSEALALIFECPRNQLSEMARGSFGKLQLRGLQVPL